MVTIAGVAAIALFCVTVVSLGGTEAGDVVLEDATPPSITAGAQEEPASDIPQAELNNFSKQLAAQFKASLQPSAFIQEVGQAAKAVASQEMQHSQWKADAVATARRASSTARHLKPRKTAIQVSKLSSRVTQVLATVRKAGHQLAARVHRKLASARKTKDQLKKKMKQTAVRHREQDRLRDQNTALRSDARRLSHELESQKLMHSREIREARDESARTATQATQVAQTLSELKNRLKSTKSRHRSELQALRARFEYARRASKEMDQLLVDSSKADAKAALKSKVRTVKAAARKHLARLVRKQAAVTTRQKKMLLLRRKMLSDVKKRLVAAAAKQAKQSKQSLIQTRIQVRLQKRMRTRLQLARKRIRALKRPVLVSLGCFSDRPGKHDLAMHAGTAATPHECSEMCRSGSVHNRFAAMQRGTQCFCGESFGQYGKEPADTCFMRCGEEACGGINRNSVYALVP